MAIEGAKALRNELTLLSTEETKNFYTKIIERNIAARLIITEEASALLRTLSPAENLELLKKRKLDIRTHVESALRFQGLSIMYGNTVAYLFPETNLVVTITHKNVAESFKATFDALFLLGKEQK